MIPTTVVEYNDFNDTTSVKKLKGNTFNPEREIVHAHSTFNQFFTQNLFYNNINPCNILLNHIVTYTVLCDVYTH